MDEIAKVTQLPTSPSGSDHTLVKMYTTFLPVLHSTWGEDGKSPLLLTVIQTAGAAHVKSREAQEHPRFVIEDVTPLLTREIVSDFEHV